MEKNYSFFVDPAETPTAELGSGFIQSYLGSGTISKGFVVATQRRAYFKGKSYCKDLKGNWKKQMQEKTVDLKDITGTGYTSIRNVGFLIATIVSALWDFVIMPLIGLASGASIQNDPKGFILNILTFLPIVIVCVLLYLFKRSTLFAIEFAGGNISFNTSWYGKEEVDNFQKNLRKAMAAIKDTEPTPAPATVAVHTYAAPATATGSAKEKAEALREYAKLKEDGIISEEEFQQMKAELVTGNK